MDVDSTETMVLAGSLVVFLLLLSAKKPRMRKFWVNPYLMDRNNKGRFGTAISGEDRFCLGSLFLYVTNDVAKLIYPDESSRFHDLAENQTFFTENFHLEAATFEMIYQRIEKNLQYKKNTRPNDRIPGKMRLAIILEFLASGTMSRHMASIYRLSKSSFTKITDQVCDAIIYEFQHEFMNFTNENCLSVANEFNYRWNFPNYLGVIDGKHIAIHCPPNSGSLFYNYKKFYSIVLLAISDAAYKFIYVNVGTYGSEGDSGVFASDRVGQQIYDNTLPLPSETLINGRKMPFYFISDDAFPLQERIMKPYSPQRGIPLTIEENIFNYRLSRARRCVGNSFGILSNNWLCLSQPLRLLPSRASKIVLTCCLLHNLLINSNNYCPPGFADYYNMNNELVEGDWRRNINQLTRLQSSSGRVSDKAKEVRENLKNYVNSAHGSVPWQNKCLN